ncbi:28S ribosomal protein S15, mitochondrial [Fopius arisanus]|uniref:Small ribosomal subunit protein uS15m n=1 Tax=Fopius arisanus TaxID=64838 RepID=A0A0C9RAB3_9HYME|nr:PREDICTED: 28S ribosomal protein S15, mitochondrial [Fopius arisanus]
MNSLLSNVKSASLIVNTFAKNGGCITRGLKSNLKIKWVRPEKIPSTHPSKSGDYLESTVKTSADEVACRYNQSQELKDAPEIVKKLFTLEYMSNQETKKMNHEKLRNLVKRHDMDYRSMEVTLAIMTSEIRHLQKMQEIHPRNKKTKVFLKELIEKRKKYLGDLRRWDYKRFEWVLEKLNIVYKPFPELWVNPTRKDSLRKLTSAHCDEIRQKKLEAYRAELEAQQIIFFKEKAEKLAFIRAEEIACGIEPTVSEEEIAAAQKKCAELQQ